MCRPLCYIISEKNSVLPNVSFNVFENLKWCCYLITNSITMKPFRFNQLLPDLCSTLFCFPEILYCISSNIFTLFFATIKNAVQKHSWDNFLIFPLKYVINIKHLIWLTVVYKSRNTIIDVTKRRFWQ